MAERGIEAVFCKSNFCRVLGYEVGKVVLSEMQEELF